MHGRRIVFFESACVRLVVIAFAQGEQGRRTPELRGKRLDDGDVLLIDIDFHGGGQIVAFGHERPAHFEHARSAGAVFDYTVHQPGVHPCFLGQHEGLGRRQVVDGDQQVGDELQLGAGAECAAVISIARKTRKNLLATRAGAAIAARVDHDVFHCGLRAGAADRTIEQDHAAFREALAGVLLDLQRQRARFDDDSTLACAGRHPGFAEQCSFESRQ